jgi:FkbH-like protein
MIKAEEDRRSIKCVVWDLDNTLWNGILSEDKCVKLMTGVVAVIKSLDDRGILQSIASKNDYDEALTWLQKFGLDEYFLYPQINWNSKVSSVKTIATALNISTAAVAFIDDQQSERDEVNFSLPEVLCLDTRGLDRLLDMPEMTPRFITEDSRLRRQMYLTDIERRKTEETFTGPQEEFLASLEMELTIGPAREEDLRRAQELTLRTNQLNTTGYTYSYDELCQFLHSPRHRLLIAELTDKYGTYGKIGLTLVECQEQEWNIKLLLMSCRVMSRGIGTILLTHLMRMAKQANVRLRAEFIPNAHNRMMYITYKFSNFIEIERRANVIILGSDLARLQALPDYIKVNLLETPRR